jgi:TonB family protein
MLPLPILNVRLTPCDADWQQMTPTAAGRHCAHCDRVVHDFTSASADDLAQARANSPDGRLCGRFRREQLARKPQLRSKLRRFLVALVLVCGLGLTSQEAWTQVRKELASSPKISESAQASQDEKPNFVYGAVAEQMPIYPGGNEALLRFIQTHISYPQGQLKSGKVFVSFVVTKAGDVRSVKVVRGLGEPFDAEAARVISLLGRWTPGAQNHVPVDVGYTVPVKFSTDLIKEPKRKKK